MDNGASSYRRYLLGDESAFDEIMNELFFGLVFFINRYVKDIHAAEDIAMDVFTELIVNPRRYNFKVTLKTYLFMLGKSRAIDYIRHRKVIDFEELTEAAQISDKNDLEEKVISDERGRKVNEALEKLPQEMRAVVHLIFFENMSYKDAARVLGKNVKQVDNLLYRAKGQLRIILGEDGEQLL
ncbi:MAG: sigma-70 family RNA polymerase sigma factor [Clostridia bacterium]|nr:sigma-70 family RNA polymerase sigma factor [Clostridia bacterium]